MFGIGFNELLVILILALIIFGPGKLPDVGKALGRSVGEFRKASRDMENELKSLDTDNQSEKTSEKTEG